MKALRILLLIIALILALVFSLTSCAKETPETPEETPEGNPQEEHTHSPAEAVFETSIFPTCETEGKRDAIIYCAVCGEEMERNSETIPPVAHTEGPFEIEAPATCIKEGVAVSKCKVCRVVLKTEELPAEEHIPNAEPTVENEIPATCSVEGSFDEVIYCAICKTELSREKKEIPTKAHTPSRAVEENVIPPTCSAVGSYDEVVYCSVCNAELSRVKRETGKDAHRPDATVIDRYRDATCFEDGSYDEVVYCALCREEISRETKTLPKLEHIPRSDKVIVDFTDSTCSAVGSYEELTVCDLCQTTLSCVTVEVAKKEHIPLAAVEENKVPSTCSTLGSYDSVVYCVVCSEEISRETFEIDFAEHTPAPAVEENRVEATCSAVGSYYAVVYCGECEEEISRAKMEIPKAKHTPAPAVEKNRVEANCVSAGSYDMIVYCSVCSAEISRESFAIEKKAHTLAEPTKENEEEATCTQEGSYDLVVYCTECWFETYRETIEVKKKAHSLKTVSAVAPTETKDGLTEGIKCSECGFVEKAQEKIPAEISSTSIKSENYAVEGDKISGTSAYSNDKVYFYSNIKINSDAIMRVYKDAECTKQESINYSSLEVGLNTFYIKVTYGNEVKIYIAEIYRRNMYTVTFNTLGGTEVNSITVEEGREISAPYAQKPAYLYAGWSIDGEPVTFPYVVTGNVEMQTLYTPIEYEITYYLNGGNEVENPAVYTIESEDIILLEPTREHYAFGGWYPDSSFTGEAISKIEKGTSGKLYFSAKWIPVEYKITYVSNGGTEISTNPKVYTVEQRISLYSFRRNHYVFGGWYESPDFEGTKITEIAKGTSGDITLYAKWTPKDYYITYYLDGGTNPDGAVSWYNIESEDFLLPEPTRDYYCFDGWYTDSSFTGERFTEIKTGTTGEINLFAKWIFEEFSISYELNGGVEDEKNPLPTVYTLESYITLPNPIREHYIFSGWYRDAELTDYHGPYIYSHSHDDLTLYAKWSPKPYSISYVYNLSFIDEFETPDKYTIADEVTLGVPTCKYYAFVGWYDNAELLGEPMFVIPVGTTGDLTLYGKWEAIEYTITYDLDGGVNHEDNPETYNTLSERIDFLAPTRPGYVFIGWDNVSTGSRISCIYHGSGGDLEIKACWKPIFIIEGNTIVKINREITHNLESDLVIPSEIDGVTIEAIGDSAFPLTLFELGSIVIPDTVKTIGEDAFDLQRSLMSVTLGSGVTSIGNNAFYECVRLSEIVNNSALPISVGSKDYGGIAAHALDVHTGVSALTKTSDDYYFYSFDGGNYLLGYGGEGTELSLPTHCNGEKYKINAYAFYDAYLFDRLHYNDGIFSMHIPDAVTEIGFKGISSCDSLVTVTGARCVSKISEYSFAYCRKLESISLIGAIKEIPSNAFLSCESLSDITLGAQVVKIYVDAFLGCTSLPVHEGAYYVASTKSEFTYLILSADKSSVSVTIHPETVLIADNAFYEQSKLRSLTIPDSVKYIGAYAFYRNAKLNILDIGNGVIEIGECAFMFSFGLVSVKLGESVKLIKEEAFNQCFALVEIINHSELEISTVLGNSGNGYIGAYAMEVHTGERRTDSIGDWFFYTYGTVHYLVHYANTEVTDVVLPDSYRGQLYVIHQYAFHEYKEYRDGNLNSLVISDGVVEIAENAFSDCRELTSVTFGKNLKKIGERAFDYTISLTEVVLPEGLTHIGESAFCFAKKLERVVIPSSVVYIGSSAFSNCPSLTSVVFSDTVGWEYNKDSTPFASQDLLDPATAAKYISQDYRGSWSKKTS